MQAEKGDGNMSTATDRTDVKYKYQFRQQSGNGIYADFGEKEKAAEQFASYLRDLGTLPVSFTYENQDYHGFGADFTERSRSVRTEERRVSHTIVLQFKETLQITVLMSIYPDYCAYEWTVYFQNIGSLKSGILKNVWGADIKFQGADPVIKGIYGDGLTEDKINGLYSPYEVNLSAETEYTAVNLTGRPSEISFPYFNLQYGNGGTYIAVGWPGSWKASFLNLEDTTAFRAGQQHFSAYLKPGECVRTPLCTFLFYTGRNEARSTNLWRHWFIDCNLRKINGNLFPPMTAAYTGQYTEEMRAATERNQIEYMQKYIDHHIPLDYWWMDAGWYFRNGEESLPESWIETGNWNVDTKRFPTEFAKVTEFGSKAGIKTLLWFEPELVRISNALLDPDGIRPEWILGQEHTWRLANLGNDDLITWLINKVSGIIDKSGITIYRQDFGNGCPLALWLENDGEKRTGMTENRYVQGYLKFWDLLIARYPDIMIDSCASGGCRNDLESMRRAVPLHKTDYNYSDYDAKQAMHYTLFQWFPYFGTMTNAGPTPMTQYGLRSSFCCWYASAYDVRRREMDWDLLRAGMEEWKRIQRFYYADYYPITEWSRRDALWRGWEFFEPESGEGFIQVFRPAGSTVVSSKLKLYGLEADTEYRITDLDSACSVKMDGAALMQDGLEVTIPAAAHAAVLLIAPAENEPSP